MAGLPFDIYAKKVYNVSRYFEFGGEYDKGSEKDCNSFAVIAGFRAVYVL